MENRITLSKRVEGKSRLWVTLLLLCFCSFTWAQVKVTGVVTDPSGEAIIGANIVEKGVPGNGTISDIDGNFTLNVKSNKATVTVSFNGFGGHLGYGSRQITFLHGAVTHYHYFIQ